MVSETRLFFGKGFQQQERKCSYPAFLAGKFLELNVELAKYGATLKGRVYMENKIQEVENSE